MRLRAAPVPPKMRSETRHVASLVKRLLGDLMSFHMQENLSHLLSIAPSNVLTGFRLCMLEMLRAIPALTPFT